MQLPLRLQSSTIEGNAASNTERGQGGGFEPDALIIQPPLEALTSYNLWMRSRIAFLALGLAFGLLLHAQDQQPTQPPAPDSSSQQASPDTQQPDNPDNSQTSDQKQSKVKKKLKDLTPNCVPGKCWGSGNDAPQGPEKEPQLSPKDRADQAAQANQKPPDQPAQPQSGINPPQSNNDSKGQAGQQTGTLNPNQPPHSAPDEKDKKYSSSKDPDPDLKADEDANSSSGAGDVAEMHPWDPHQSAKDVEVGDFYYKEGNYRAALSRYEEALYLKQNDAVATFRLAQTHEKMKNFDQARKYYESYLKILPNGAYAHDAHKALEKLNAQGSRAGNQLTSPPAEKPR